MEVMQTICKFVFKSDYDILTCLTYHNNKMMGHQGANSPLLTPGISPKCQKSAKKNGL